MEPSTPSRGVPPASTAANGLSPVTPVNRKRKCYFGDVTPRDFSTPRRAQKALDLMQKSMDKVKSNLKATQMRLQRALHKVKDLSSLLEHLKDERQIPEDVASMIEVMKLSNEVCLTCGHGLFTVCMTCDMTVKV